MSAAVSAASAASVDASGSAAVAGDSKEKDKRAAVLIGVFEWHSEWYVVLTTRASALRSHGGEVAAPGTCRAAALLMCCDDGVCDVMRCDVMWGCAGGKRDSTDVNDIMTALRETHEEIGLPPERVHVLTTLPSVLSKHMLSVRPVLARIPAPSFMLDDAAADGGVHTPSPYAHFQPCAAARSALLAWRSTPTATASATAAEGKHKPSASASSSASSFSSSDSFHPVPNPTEVGCVFAVPLALFLCTDGYSFVDTEWVGAPFRIHRFVVTTRHWRSVEQCTAAPLGAGIALQNPPSEFLVWGYVYSLSYAQAGRGVTFVLCGRCRLTAYVVIAAAALVYRRPPAFLFAVRPPGKEETPAYLPPPQFGPNSARAGASSSDTLLSTTPAPLSRLVQLSLEAERRIRSGAVLAATNEQLRLLLAPKPAHSTIVPLTRYDEMAQIRSKL